MTYFNRYLEIAKSATASEIELATQWYCDAELIAHDVTRILNSRGIVATLETGASVVSSFSPRQRWNRNVVQALEFAHTGKATGLKKAKVERILDEGLDYDFIKGIYAGCEVKLMNILFQKAQAGDTPSIKHFLEMSGFISTKEEVKPGLQIEIKYVDSKREGE
jgi:hypothetical protein